MCDMIGQWSVDGIDWDSKNTKRMEEARGKLGAVH